MQPKLIALDLDETTLNFESHLSPATREALSRAADMGIQVVIASGRALDTLPEEIMHFPGIRYAICGNGAAVYDIVEKCQIESWYIPEEATGRILELMQGWPIAWEAFFEGRAYGQSDYIAAPDRWLHDSRTVGYVQATRIPVPDIEAFIRQHAAMLDSLAAVVPDLDTKQEAAEALQQVPGIYVTTSVHRLVEISHRDCGKHNALARLCERLGVAQAETAAFGNGDNDAEMLAWAGLGAAVSNATPACLAAADVVVGHHCEDGVARAFADLFGI